MAPPTSIYKETDIHSPYYSKSSNEFWDNYHTLFLDEPSEELISELLKINPLIELIERPESPSPELIFQNSPHALIIDNSPLSSRQFYIEDYLELHLGWKDRKSTALYSPGGYDVFLICDKDFFIKHRDLVEDSFWHLKPSVFGIEFFMIEHYKQWLEQNPGNGQMERVWTGAEDQ